jgi:hypothetical protein
MRFAIVALTVAIAGCDNFDYTATVTWSSSDRPEVISLAIDGDDIPPDTSNTLERSFGDWAESQTSPLDMIVVTTTGTITLHLAPSACGGWCSTSDVPASRNCDNISSELDRWRATYDGFVGGTGDDPFYFEAVGGQCATDGGGANWAAN